MYKFKIGQKVRFTDKANKCFSKTHGKCRGRVVDIESTGNRGQFHVYTISSFIHKVAEPYLTNDESSVANKMGW